MKYNKPFLITETSHPDTERPEWYDYIADECSRMKGKNLPIQGICIYPIVARPDWDFPDHWHQSGVWDIHDFNEKKRQLHEPTLEAILNAQFVTKEFAFQNTY